MKLAEWRHAWTFLAISACGAPGWMKEQRGKKISVFDAPPLAGAEYIARLTDKDFDRPYPEVSNERGRYKCTMMVRLVERDRHEGRRRPEVGEAPDRDWEYAAKTCDEAIGQALAQNAGFVFVVDSRGPHWLTTDEVIAAASPIDTPQKAALAAWAHGHDISWWDGHDTYGSLEDARVRAVDGGFEVASSSSSTESNCGGNDSRQTVTDFRITLFVARDGSVTERDKTSAYSYDVADPCHPRGRRPADFIDIASGTSLEDHLARDLHHEAESVRAFERIARELRFHGAPAELCAAAESAARDERDHAARCARLANRELHIAADGLPIRELIDLAIDNACEGCVGESYAALVNVAQATDAAEPALRDHFAAIATDELAHAALAHAIADWLTTQLDADARARVRTAQYVALATLRASLPTIETAATRTLGIPTGEHAHRLLDRIAELGR